MKVGDLVLTTNPDSGIDDWTEIAIRNRKWKTVGRIIEEHNSHGLCFDVLHQDNTVGSYEPSEFIPLGVSFSKKDWEILRKWSAENLFKIISYMRHRQCLLRIAVRDLFPNRS